ncbi:MAG: U32 family peptidase [Clostridia bacterium]|nr:U32 family peptidase [Clostridia bacterium]
MKQLPELLCPAGSPEALDAAIDGGADAVYFGGASFNARMNAKNFGGDALRSAVLRAHAFGVKVYLTLNTLVTDRELPAFLEAARDAANAGVDALIVADLGGAAEVRRAMPSLELHASTQMSGHSVQMGKQLATLGFSRMVVARETSLENLKTLVQQSPIEIEYFAHGALCVSHSGQCLFSSLVGGRSGNRGECAQPCRLPYACNGCKGKADGYPLSLKDLSLAEHIPTLIDTGVASLKIEGRMKSPEYVYAVASVFRRLLDERRCATQEEIARLSQAFSRSGFTDGYFTAHVGRSMLGVRSAEDKSQSRALTPYTGLQRKIPLTLDASIREDQPISLSLSDGSRSVTVYGEVPQAAINAPLTFDVVERNLKKFGGTAYQVEGFTLNLGKNLMLPLSRLNDLRRRALLALEEQAANAVKQYPPIDLVKPSAKSQERTPLRSARFYHAGQLTKQARAYFDRIYLPLWEHKAGVEGVVLPPVIFDADTARVAERLQAAKQSGARYALVGNLGHLPLALQADLIPVGDFRLNVTNGSSVRKLSELGFEEILLSPELTLPQIRDVGGNTAAIVYGRIPLMLLEKCVGKEIADCNTCQQNKLCLQDRRGVRFPVLREWEHRSVVYNSLPTCMSDRAQELKRYSVTAQHFLFSTETPSEVDRVIEAFRNGTALDRPVRRI